MEIIYIVIKAWTTGRQLCERHRDEALAADPELRLVGQLLWRSSVCEVCPA